MSPSQILVDSRGYIFKFPSLGLPDISGEWHIIQAAIALKEAADPQFFASTGKGQRRYASDGCGLFEVEHHGAVWILPLLYPQKSSPRPERFIIKARRERLETMPSRYRVSVLDGGETFMVAHPTHLLDFKFNKNRPANASKTPTEKDEKNFWAANLSSLYAPTLPNDSPLLHCEGLKAEMSHDPVAAAAKHDREGVPHDHRLPWTEAPGDLLDQDWVQEVVTAALEAGTRAKVPLASLECGMDFRTGEVGGRVKLQYAVLASNEQLPHDEDWKPLPARAFKPGKELVLVNQARERFGRRAITQLELERERDMWVSG